jgi:predicted esterase
LNQSLLLYEAHRPSEGAAATALVLGLHDRGGDARQVLPLLAAISGLIAVEAPQALRPIVTDTRGYVLDGQGYHWYFGSDASRPEPATFGESLWSLEAFLADLRERHPGRKPVVLGVGQGGVLAVSLALMVPDLIGAVVAVEGGFPVIRGWDPPERRADGLPVVMVHDSEAGASAGDAFAEAVNRLQQIGYKTEIWNIPGVRTNLLLLAEKLTPWLAHLHPPVISLAGLGGAPDASVL